LNLYAESSAVLAWLLGDEGEARVRRTLSAATIVFASDLTLIECDRVLIRAVTLQALDEREAAKRRSSLQSIAAGWQLLRVSPEIVSRARQPFPAEPIRTLDALHLASAITARSAVPDLVLLSLDERIRKAGLGMGFTVHPN
jgi:predicted nucleic acid-binding protein